MILLRYDTKALYEFFTNEVGNQYFSSNCVLISLYLKVIYKVLEEKTGRKF